MCCPHTDADPGFQSSLIKDRTDKINMKLGQIFEKPTLDDIGHALEAICLMSGHVSSTENYALFRKVMQAPIPEVHSQRKWEASRLTIRNGYKGDGPLPEVENPHDILAFLDHHFGLAISGQNQDEPIHNALHALACAPGADTDRILKYRHLTTRSFVRGVCYAFQDGRSAELRRAALLFLPLIGDKWFNAYSSFATLTQMNGLCEDWASVMGSTNHTDDV